MASNVVLGWLIIVANAWFILSGLLYNDMGGLVSLGYSPDVPLSFDRAPGRFILGIAIYGAILAIGIRMILAKPRA
jgi:hypothetical protein